MLARPKKKAQRLVVVSESSESSVVMSEGTASSADDDAVEEEDLLTPECGPSRIFKRADVLESKTSEEHAKELTMDKEILEQVVELIGETVVESPEIPSPYVSLGMAKP
ncbi:hypothetical protein AXG93_2035s1260 [Marchantia polymorpha subsp. ruderalis]|uniref:Uncharacterized protein n=1 Tax=Marchantia polymorpha subsp. ruderalis TaxID=1480154 RepID=A0A176VPB7_MARPO|nr:hypothetical protein AXG93_2035s1260 [Marchantia polymorpha subsp. ruderalis]